MTSRLSGVRFPYYDSMRCGVVTKWEAQNGHASATYGVRDREIGATVWLQGGNGSFQTALEWAEERQ